MSKSPQILVTLGVFPIDAQLRKMIHPFSRHSFHS
uniref:Uncharacterized protein n=1 Tax=Rhizophora mucronata TaxID=61149 RepID=A0A2P2IS46_RHIMU